MILDPETAAGDQRRVGDANGLRSVGEGSSRRAFEGCVPHQGFKHCLLDDGAFEFGVIILFLLQISKSDDRVQSLAILMLHYCAGLQHCMEEMENERSAAEAAALDSDHSLLTSQSFAESGASSRDLDCESDVGVVGGLETMNRNESDRSFQSDLDSQSDEEEARMVAQIRSAIEKNIMSDLAGEENPTEGCDIVVRASDDEAMSDVARDDAPTLHNVEAETNDQDARSC